MVNYILDAFTPEAELLAANPWYAGGVSAMRTPIQYNTSTEALLGPFLQGLGGGALMGFGKQQVYDEQKPQYSDIISAFTGSPYTPAEDWTVRTGKQDLLKALYDSERTQKLEDIFAEALVKDAATRGELGSIGGAKFKITREPGGEIAIETEGQRDLTPESNPEKSGYFKPGYQSKYMDRFDELRRRGIPPGAAATQAEKDTKDERDRISKTYGQIEEMRANAAQAWDLAARSNDAIGRAGLTGSDPLTRASRTAGYLASFFSPEQKAKLAGEEELEALKPEILRQSFVKGVGPLSDVESRTFFGAGPAASKTQESNLRFSARMNLLGDLTTQYADALEMAREQGIEKYQVDKLWGQYKREFPIVSGDEVILTERPSFNQWLDAKGSGQVIDPVTEAFERGEQALGGPPPGARPTGRTKNGKPVYQLEDGRLWQE